MGAKGWMSVAAAGWVVAIAFAGAWYGERRDASVLEARATEAIEAYDAMAHRAEAHRVRAETQAGQIAQLEDTLNTIERRVATLAPPADGELPAPDAEPLAEAPPAAAEADATPGNAFLNAMKGMMTDEMVAITAKSQFPVYFQPLLDELQLPPDREKIVRGILERNLEEQMRYGVRMMSPSDADAPSEYNLDENLLEDLGGLLDISELEIAATYQSELPERLLHNSISSQLSSVASDVPEESRLLIADVYVEESFAATDEREAAAAVAAVPSDPAADIAQQRVVLERVRARLDGALPPEDMAAIDRLDALMVSAANMFRSMSDGAEAVPTP